MFSIKNKTVLLTGATGGIGNEIAHQMSSLGAKLILTGTKKDRLNDLSNKLPNESDFIVSNLNTNENVQNFSDELENKNYIIDILINNAGITKDNLFLRMKEDEWSSVLNLNLNSTAFLTQKIIKGMIRRKSGRIIFITSIIGHSGNPGQSNYSASKAALTAFSKSIANEVASRGITCNCIAPGFIKTPMTDKLTEDQQNQILKTIPVSRFGTAEDIASACVYLSSDEASYITGSTIHINGGMGMF
ncbi:MAG: beta-ketoacyl-ACP reductase [SAR116 cluster bacterium]|nr:beta-ketoacyl-ACP reductase [SAR116 cluster bacterium]RPH10927.1 MAG: beta-ketoacyl-ACP reductase [Alphaproteobacteria bacterium TMED54]|tara:strand:+ start:135 stop:872 length:738 start_codon:yes stop_codon:yes gene_type:complete